MQMGRGAVGASTVADTADDTGGGGLVGLNGSSCH